MGGRVKLRKSRRVGRDEGKDKGRRERERRVAPATVKGARRQDRAWGGDGNKGGGIAKGKGMKEAGWRDVVAFPVA